jgi:hypothetical protein
MRAQLAETTPGTAKIFSLDVAANYQMTGARCNGGSTDEVYRP